MSIKLAVLIIRPGSPSSGTVRCAVAPRRPMTFVNLRYVAPFPQAQLKVNDSALLALNGIPEADAVPLSCIRACKVKVPRMPAPAGSKRTVVGAVVGGSRPGPSTASKPIELISAAAEEPFEPDQHHAWPTACAANFQASKYGCGEGPPCSFRDGGA